MRNKLQSQWWPDWTTPSSFFGDPGEKNLSKEFCNLLWEALLEKKPFLLGLSQNGGTPLQTLTLTLFFRSAKVTQIGVQGSTPLPKLILICHFFNNQKVAQARPFRSGLCLMTAAGRGDLGPKKGFFSGRASPRFKMCSFILKSKRRNYFLLPSIPKL